MGAVSSALAAGVIFYFMIIAAANIKIVLDNNVDEINEIEIDEEVKRLDTLAEKWRITYHEETHWSRVPTRMRAVLTSSVVFMSSSCYMLMMFNVHCFKEYDLLYTIQEHLDGQVINIVLPLGQAAILLFALSCVLLTVFLNWATVSAPFEFWIKQNCFSPPMALFPQNY